MPLLLALLAAPATAQDPDRGALLAALGGCGACHTAEGGAPYAGGHAIETEHGTFYGTNLTPDPEHGLGRWSLDDFTRAMRRGRGPDRSYWPAFPYPAFSGLSEADLADLWAFLQALPPDPAPDRPHETPHTALSRWLWRALWFRPRPLPPDPEWTPEQARGAYLVQVVGHCGGCHTPRSRWGRPDPRRALAGSDDPPHPAPNLTPHAEGLEGWTLEDHELFLELGLVPSGDVVGGQMRRIVRDGTAALSAADRRAIALYLLALEPQPSEPPHPD